MIDEKLQKTVNKALKLIQKAAHADFVDDLNKASAGREKSLFPLVIAAAWQSGFIVSPEIKVMREKGADDLASGGAGAVDAIFFDDEYDEQDFAVEAKVSQQRTMASDIPGIEKKLSDAKKQLDGVKRNRNGLKRQYGLVACVISKINYAASDFESAQLKHEGHTKERLTSIKAHYSSSDKLYCNSIAFSNVHRIHNQNSLSHSGKQNVVWCGGIAITLKMMRQPK